MLSAFTKATIANNNITTFDSMFIAVSERTTRTVDGQVKSMQVQCQVKNYATVRAQFIFSNFEFLMTIIWNYYTISDN